MITVTTPSVVNNLTPITEGVANNSAGTTAVNVDFTNALNAQLTATTTSANLAAAPVLDEAALLTAKTALLAATAQSSENNSATPALAAQQTAVATAVLTTQQPVISAEAVPLTASPLLTTSTVNTLTIPETTITNADSEILSNVTDTLKFIATGAKLGDTLPEGQVIRLQNVNTSTPLTQQTVQAAVQQTVNAPVNTLATVLAQQAMPAQTGEILSTQQMQIQSSETLEETAVLDIQNKIAIDSATAEKQTIASLTTSAQQQSVQTEKPVVTAMSTQTVQTKLPDVTVSSVQTQTVQIETPVLTTTQAQTVQNETPVVTAIPTQAQPVQTETLVVTATATQTEPVQTGVIATPTQAQAQTPVVTATPTQTQTDKTETLVVSATQGQTEKTVSATTVQIQTVQTEKPVMSAVTEGQTNIQQATTLVTDKNLIQEAVIAKNETSERSVAGEVSARFLQNDSTKNTLNNNDSVGSDEDSLQNAELLLTQTSQDFVQNENVVTTVEVSEKSSSSNITVETQENAPLEERVLETTAPAVTAQTAPVQIEADAATFDAPSSSTSSEEKPALTPAKNLLADVLANRNNGGDTASNSGDKKGNDASANAAALLTDSTAKNTLDNKSLETKPFASLLNNEKSEAGSALPAATNDKVAPQVAAASVNKLAQDMKADVPALTRPLSHPNWNQEVGERIIWMNNRGISSAEIRMNPENMGPITVRIDVDTQQQTSVSFTAQNADVRTALEASIPKLREMLNSQNLNVADVNVSQQSSTSADSNGSQRQNAQMAADASANGQGNRQSNQEVDANGNPIRQVGANGEEIAIDEFANGQVIEGNGTNGLLSIFA